MVFWGAFCCFVRVVFVDAGDGFGLPGKEKKIQKFC
jgi:hypothetical protein